MAAKQGSRTSNENLSAEQKKQIKAQETAREKRNKKILSDVSLRPGMGATKKVAIGTAVTAVGIASALVPAKFVIDNMRYEMTMHVEGVRYDSYSITAKRGTKISALEHYEITGYSFKGFYKNAACTEPYLDSDKVTANAVVYCKYEPISYKVTYPEDQNGYKIITAPTEVEYEQDLTFTLAVLDKYNKSEVKVYVNGNLIESDDGIYTVKNVKSDLNITVKGIEENYYDFTVTVNGQICKLHTNKLQLSKAELFDVDAFINGSWSTIRDYLIETSMSENETYYSTTGITKENLLLLSNEDLLNVISTGTFDEMFVSAADKYGNGVDVSGFVVEDDLEIKLETEYATLNKLSFASNAVFASSTEISGEVLMPTKYLEKNAKDEFKLKNLTKLNNGAFADCSKITSVKIGRTITKITRNPFSNCERLTKIQVDENNTAFTSENNCVIENINGIKTLRLGCGTSVIPEDVVVIGESAFEGCANLTDIVVPSSVDTISKNAFKGCVNLKTVTLPLRQDVVNGELEILGIKVFEGAFAGCVNAQTLNLGSEIETTDTKIFSDFGKNYGFTLNVGEGFKVVKAEAFANLTNLTKVDFNEGLEYINANAFAGCANLQEINLPDSLKEIGEKAFDGCNNVVRLSIGSSLENIGASAFSGLTKLQRLEYGGNISTNPEGMFASIGTESDICTVEISSSVRYINPKLFQNCTGITNLVLSDGVKSIGDYSFAGCSNLKEIKFGNSLESIENNAFEGCISLTNFVLPDTVVTIQENAFKDCTSLTEVTIPKAVKTLSGTAFAGCSNVSTINCNVNNSTFTGDVFANLGTVVGKGLKLYFNNEGKIRDNFFSNNEIITEIELGENVDSIGKQSFANCTSLKKIQLNEKITEIGTEAFAGCTSLIEITIPGSVKSIGAKAFGGCTALKTAEIQASLDEKVTDEQGKYNGQQMFFNCTNLQDVQFTGTATFVPTEAFEGCSRLTDVGLTGKIKYIREGAFKNCSSITSIHIPDSVKNIESKAFSGCLKLTALNNLENTKITKLNDLVFADCSNLKTINLPTGLTEIGVQTFSGCSGLLSVKLDGVVTIGNAAFSSCTSLTEIDIPDSVTSLGNLAFDGCSDIKSVKLGTRLTYLFAETFRGCEELENLEYNANYDKNSINLGVVFPYLKNIVVGENVTAIRDNEFNKSTTISGASVKTTTKQVGNISSVILGSQVKIIGTKAFAGTSITSINLNQVATINAGAFYGSSLESINLGTVVTTLGESAFEDCESLNSVIMGSSIETIPSKAFANTSIFRVDLPSNIKEIAEDAFGTSVKELKYNSTINEGKEYTLKDIFTNLESVEVGGNVSVIRDNEFRDLGKLISLKLNSGLTEIGFAAFNNAFSEDSKVSVSLALPETVTTIGEWAFGENERLTKVNLANVADIKDNAFYNTSLSELIVPDSVKTIGKGAFGDIQVLTKVTLGSGLESIYDDSFTFDYEGEVGTNAITELAYNSHIEVKLSEEVLTKNTRNVTTTKTLINAFPSVTKVTIGNNVTTIKNNEFINSKISNLTLGTGVTTIGYAAFENSQIKEVEISNSVESIGGQAFAGTTTLKKVVIHGCDKDISLGEGVFAGCNNLTNAELYNVKTVSDKLFQGCSTLTYLVMNEVETVGNYAFEGTSLKTVELSAKTIGSHAFKDCEKLTYLTINDVESIGVSAFQNCRTLKSIELPSTLKQIGSEAFKDCMAIELLQSEANLESVGNNVFENLGSSTLGVTLRIGNMVEEVKEYTYSSLTNVKEMEIGENVKKLSSFAFGDAVKDVQKLTFNAISAQIVPDGTNNIFAHLGENVSKNLVVEIGESVQSIPNDIFSGCLKLTDITIPESVTTIGDYAFDEAGLKGIQFRGISSLTSIGDSAFMNSKLEEINIPKTVESIGVSAFSGVSSLYEFVFKGNLVTEIKESTFENCTNLKAIELKNENTFVRQSAFKNSGLETINSKNIIQIEESGFENTKLTKFTLGNLVDNIIGNHAFLGCKLLTDFVLNDTLKIVQESAFEGCSKLTRFSYEDTSAAFESGNIVNIGKKAFKDTGFTYAEFFEELEILGSEAFAGSALEAIDLTLMSKENVEIGESAFENCSSLDRIYNFGDGIKEIKARTFAGTNINRLNLNSAIEKIDYTAFENTKVEHLAYISDIEVLNSEDETDLSKRLKDVFPNLVEVSLDVDVENLKDNEFANLSTLKNVNIACNLQTIGAYAFIGCDNLVNVGMGEEGQISFPETLNTIGEEAFNGCKSLAGVLTLPSSLTKLESGVFNLCREITEVNFGGVTEIGNSTFKDCAALMSVNLGLVQKIQDNAFANCKGLTAIDLASSVNYLGKDSFVGCTGITELTYNSNMDIGDYTIKKDAHGRPLTHNGKPIKIYNDRLKDVFQYLTSVVVGNDVTRIRNNEFSGGNSETPYSLTSITLGNGVEIIGENAFKNASLTSISLKNVTTIEKNAFAKCGNLSNIKLGKNLGAIGENAFDGISEERNVDIPIGMTYKEFAQINFANLQSNPLCTDSSSSAKLRQMETRGKIVVIKSITLDESFSEYAFRGYQKLTSLTINYKKVPQFAFAGCVGLGNVTITTDTLTVNEQAFSGCNGLENVTITSNTLGIHKTAFADSTIENLEYNCAPSIFWYEDEDKIEGADLRWKDLLKSKTAEEANGWDCGVKKVICGNVNGNELIVRDNEFAGITTIEEVTLANVNEINTDSFKSGCVKKLTLDVGNSFKVVGDLFKIETENKDYSAYNKEQPGLADVFGYDEVYKGVSITPIGGSLTDVYIKNGPIGAYEFAGIRTLKTVKIESEITEIGANAFKDCRALQTVELNLTKLETIGEDAFYNCSSSRDVIIIGGDVNNFVNIDFTNLNSNPLTAKYFSSSEQVRSDCYLYLNEVVTGSYIKEVKLNHSGSISEYAFQGYKCLTKVEFEYFGGLREYTFADCINLKTVNLGEDDGDSFIGEGVFKGCKELTSISIPKYCLTIGKEAFMGCSKLSSVTLSNQEAIYKDAFKDCISLTSITIPGSITDLGRFWEVETVNGVETVVQKFGTVFDGCTALKTVTLSSSINQLNVNEFNGKNGVNTTIDNFTCSDLILVDCLPNSNKTKLYEVYTDDNDIKYYKDLDLEKYYNSEGEKLDKAPESIMSYRLGKLLPNVKTVTIGGSKIRSKEFSSHLTLNKLNISIFGNAEKEYVIEDEAFYNCEKLKSVNSIFYIEFEDENGYDCSVYFDENDGGDNAIIGRYEQYTSGLKIGNEAFRDCVNLNIKRIYATEIGNYAFMNTGITELDLDVSTIATELHENSRYGYQHVDGHGVAKINYVGKVGNYAFKDCAKMERLTFNVGEMGGSVFYNTTNLKSVLMSGGHLGDSAFYCVPTVNYYAGRENSVFCIDADNYVGINYAAIKHFKDVRFVSSSSTTKKEVALYGIMGVNESDMAHSLSDALRDVKIISGTSIVYWYHYRSGTRNYQEGKFALYLDGNNSNYFTNSTLLSTNWEVTGGTALHSVLANNHPGGSKYIYSSKLLNVTNYNNITNYKISDDEELFSAYNGMMSTDCGYYNTRNMINYNKVGVAYYPDSLLHL